MAWMRQHGATRTAASLGPAPASPTGSSCCLPPALLRWQLSGQTTSPGPIPSSSSSQPCHHPLQKLFLNLSNLSNQHLVREKRYLSFQAKVAKTIIEDRCDDDKTMRLDSTAKKGHLNNLDTWLTGRVFSQAAGRRVCNLAVPQGASHATQGCGAGGPSLHCQRGRHGRVAEELPGCLGPGRP